MSKGLASAKGSAACRFLVVEDGPVEEGVLFSVPLFGFGSAAGSTTLAGSAGFGLTSGFSSVF